MRQKVARSKGVLSRNGAPPAGRSDRFPATVSQACRGTPLPVAVARVTQEAPCLYAFFDRGEPIADPIADPRGRLFRADRRRLDLAVAMVGNSLPMGFVLVRFLLSLAFVFATYNPTGYSLFHWITDVGAGVLSLKAVVALALVMIYYAIFRVVFAAFRRSGLIVAGLAAVLFVSELASLVVPRQSQPFWHFNILLSQYIILCAVAIVVSFGLSWSHLIEQLTGQLQKRYVQR